MTSSELNPPEKSNRGQPTKTGYGRVSALFLKGAAGSFVIKLAAAGLLFFAQVVLARLLGAHHYGAYAFVLSWMTILAIPAKMGLETSLLRFLPEYAVQHDWSLFRGIIRFSFSLVSMLSLSILLIGNAVLLLFRERIDADVASAFRIMLFVLPLFALTAIRQSCLRGLKRVVQAEAPEGVLRPVVLVFAAWSLSHRLSEFTVTWAWICQLLAVFFSFIYGTVLLKKALPRDYSIQPARMDRANWVKVSAPMLMMNSMNIVMSQAALVILGFYQSTEQVALFSASSRIVILATFALLAVNSIAAPLISELYYADKKDELEKLLRLAASVITIVTLIAGVVLFFGAEWILSLFGIEFTDAAVLLKILLVGFMFKSLAGPASFVLNLTGRQNITARAMFVAVFFSLALSFVLIPQWGALGAALSSSITMVVWNLTLLVLNIKIVGINPSIGSLLRKPRTQRNV